MQHQFCTDDRICLTETKENGVSLMQVPVLCMMACLDVEMVQLFSTRFFAVAMNPGYSTAGTVALEYTLHIILLQE